jgi:hypothetical protein
MKIFAASVFLTFFYFNSIFVAGSEIEDDDLIFAVYPNHNAIIDCSGVKNDNKICWHGENFEVEGNSYKFKTYDSKLLIQSTNETDIEYYRSRRGRKPHSLRLYSE